MPKSALTPQTALPDVISFRLKKAEQPIVAELLHIIGSQINESDAKKIILHALNEASQPQPTSDEKDSIIAGLEREINEEKEQRRSLDQQVIDLLQENQQLKEQLAECEVKISDWAKQCLLRKDEEKIQPLLTAFERRHAAGRAHSDTFENFIVYLFDVIADAAHPDELLKPIVP